MLLIPFYGGQCLRLPRVCEKSGTFERPFALMQVLRTAGLCSECSEPLKFVKVKVACKALCILPLRPGVCDHVHSCASLVNSVSGIRFKNL